MAAASTSVSLKLRGPSGEPVDFRRAALSHGLTNVAPFAVGDGARWLAAVARLPDGSPRAIVLHGPGDRAAGETCRVVVGGPKLDRAASAALRSTLTCMLALDVDLNGFYGACARDPLLSWATSGAGRFVRSQTVFEDVIRTICTTNCAFSATRRMIVATVDRLGDATVGPPPASCSGGGSTSAPAASPDTTHTPRAFPTPEQIARAGADFLRDVARAGYRAERIAAIAEGVATGEIDLEALRPTTTSPLSDEDAYELLLRLPGVGPYAASHAMMLIGRYSQPVLDSWSRPAYARVAGSAATDGEIRRRFETFGRFAGLAFWLAVTKSWID